MVNVEHQVAVSALRTDASRFKLLLSREVPVVTSADGVIDNTASLRRSLSPPAMPPPSYVAEPHKARNLPSSLLNTTSLGRTIPNASMLHMQPHPMAMQVKIKLHYLPCL